MLSACAWERLRLVGSAALAGALLCCVLATSAGAVEYVINISVDALRSDAVGRWVNDPNDYLPNFQRLRTEGAWTDDARTDYSRTSTSPDHASILTGRPVMDWAGGEGHLWGENTSNGPWATYGLTFHDAHIRGRWYNGHEFPEGPNKPSYEYVSSVFDVAHDAGLRTGLYAGKNRFNMYIRSYDADHSDNGVNKIDDSLVEQVNRRKLTSQQLIDRWKTQMDSDAPLQYSFIHFADPDEVGHINSWNTSKINSVYMTAVKDVDDWLGQIFTEIDNDPRLKDNTAIVLTSDHGGQGFDHGNAALLNDYTVPFYVWGPGVAAGADLYALNPQYTDPGNGRPTQGYTDQPIRNGYSANLCLDLLGLGPIPGSSLNFDQTLTVFDPSIEASLLSVSGPAGLGLSLNARQMVTMVPEPSTLVLAALSAAALLAYYRCRGRRGIRDWGLGIRD